MKVDPKFTIFNLPPGVPLEYVKILTKHTGPSEEFLYIIFKCKKACKTIFTPKNLIEMDKFVAKITDHPNWTKVCTRENPEDLTDAMLCGRNTYFNITNLIRQHIDINEQTTQEQLDQVM